MGEYECAHAYSTTVIFVCIVILNHQSRLSPLHSYAPSHANDRERPQTNMADISSPPVLGPSPPTSPSTSYEDLALILKEKYAGATPSTSSDELNEKDAASTTPGPSPASSTGLTPAVIVPLPLPHRGLTQEELYDLPFGALVRYTLHGLRTSLKRKMNRVHNKIKYRNGRYDQEIILYRSTSEPLPAHCLLYRGRVISRPLDELDLPSLPTMRVTAIRDISEWPGHATA